MSSDLTFSCLKGINTVHPHNESLYLSVSSACLPVVAFKINTDWWRSYSCHLYTLYTRSIYGELCKYCMSIIFACFVLLLFSLHPEGAECHTHQLEVGHSGPLSLGWNSSLLITEIKKTRQIFKAVILEEVRLSRLQILSWVEKTTTQSWHNKD